MYTLTQTDTFIVLF